MNLKIKICGMREPGNIIEVASLKPDLMGFIFYPSSLRYAGSTLNAEILSEISPTVIKTGVFVNEDIKTIAGIIENFQLDCVQLHGNETPDLCFSLKERGIQVIKTFSISAKETFKRCSDFIKCTDYFLFDTAVSGFGGSGQKFNWKDLVKYDLNHPFFLSGGIASEDYNTINEIDNPSFYGIDLNSRFEIKPGLKDIAILKKFIAEIRRND
jgi:phosphoribosylanthranilate isomerase